MGSQVNFYMVRQDEEDFCRYVLSDPAVTILRGMHTESPHVPVYLPLPDGGAPYCYCLAFWNRFVAEKEAVVPLHRVPDCGNPKGRFDVNAILYPVVDLLRSVERPEGLTPGRIWVETNRRDLDFSKQKLFRAWFQRLARYLNRWPYRWGMYRIGPHTKAYFDAGGKAIGYAMGEPKEIVKQPGVKIIRRNVRTLIQQPEIENDGGESDLTIEL